MQPLVGSLMQDHNRCSAEVTSDGTSAVALSVNNTTPGSVARLSRIATIAGLLLFASLLSSCTGCGGFSAQSIKAADVFSNKAETWTFKNGYGDLTWIDVLPVDESHTVWHYTKETKEQIALRLFGLAFNALATNQQDAVNAIWGRAYWNPTIKDAGLYFDLERTADGSWYSTGGRIIMPQGCPWAVPWCAGPVDVTYTVPSDPGMPRPYLILADSGVTDLTTYPNPDPGTLWQTLMYMEDGMLLSDQREGPCLHEKWYFAVGQGLVKVVPLDDGDCKGLDPKLTMERIDFQVFSRRNANPSTLWQTHVEESPLVSEQREGPWCTFPEAPSPDHRRGISAQPTKSTKRRLFSYCRGPGLVSHKAVTSRPPLSFLAQARSTPNNQHGGVAQ